MKINREQLITIIQTEITRLQDRARDRHTRALNDSQNAASRYVEETRGAWREFAGVIRSRVNDEEAVTWDDVPAALRSRSLFPGGIRFFNAERAASPVPARFDPDRVQGVVPLVTLRRVLEATTDETVSTYALEKMGFPLGKTLLRAAFVTAEEGNRDR